MKITVIGRGNVGGGLATRWERAGHEVRALGSDGGDGADADVVVVAVPSGSIPDALRNVTGIEGKTAVDTTNNRNRERRSWAPLLPLCAAWESVTGPSRPGANIESSLPIRYPNPR
jgi:predicted dinucleotide-binding enzyme